MYWSDLNRESWVRRKHRHRRLDCVSLVGWRQISRERQLDTGSLRARHSRSCWCEEGHYRRRTRSVPVTFRIFLLCTAPDGCFAIRRIFSVWVIKSREWIRLVQQLDENNNCSSHPQRGLCLTGAEVIYGPVPFEWFKCRVLKSERDKKRPIVKNKNNQIIHLFGYYSGLWIECKWGLIKPSKRFGYWLW